jgi:hypothetical protein
MFGWLQRLPAGNVGIGGLFYEYMICKGGMYRSRRINLESSKLYKLSTSCQTNSNIVSLQEWLLFVVGVFLRAQFAPPHHLYIILNITIVKDPCTCIKYTRISSSSKYTRSGVESPTLYCVAVCNGGNTHRIEQVYLC